MVLIKPPTRQHGIPIWKALLYLALGICIILASESHYHYRNIMNEGLRGETSIATSTNSAESVEQKVDVAVATSSPPKPAPPNENVVIVATQPPSQATPKSQDKLLCGRKIGIDLSDQSKWPDYTPSYFDKEPESGDAVVLSSDKPFGNTPIIALSHAIDLAYDKKCEVIITKGEYALRNTQIY